MPSQSETILQQLVAFPTVSRDSNLDLIDWCEAFLQGCGARTQRVFNQDASKANLYASIGPHNEPGIMLSGHTDVVPVDGQDWSKPAFQLSEEDGKLYGRGTCDMKGFIASALYAATLARERVLRTPLHFAFSYDEEVGCIGVRRLIEVMQQSPQRPRICIVGEPTSMSVATGHKGKVALRAHCTGRTGHSALAPNGLNAIHLATDVVRLIREAQDDIVKHGTRDPAYEISYTTYHIGVFNSGTALNIIPAKATIDFEIRNLGCENADALIERLEHRCEPLVQAQRERFPEANIRIERRFSYPGLDTAADSEAVSLVKSLTGDNREIKVAFGTEGGLFSEQLGIDTVICGPGSMDQGHKPDEFISREQLARCDDMMTRLVDVLCTE